MINVKIFKMTVFVGEPSHKAMRPLVNILVDALLFLSLNTHSYINGSERACFLSLNRVWWRVFTQVLSNVCTWRRPSSLGEDLDCF